MKKFVLTLLVAVLAVPAFAQSAPSRIAVIDVSRVLRDSAPGKSALERLNKMRDERAAKAQKMNEELQSLEQQINQKKMSLAEDKVAEMQKQFSDKQIAFQRYAQDADRELKEARERSLQDMEKQIMPVINEVGKEMGVAAIFNKFESGLIYASDAIDLTDVVVKKFNESSAKPAAAPAKP